VDLIETVRGMGYRMGSEPGSPEHVD
jgi:hypothetical protein